MPDLAKVLPAVRKVASKEIGAMPQRRSSEFPMQGDNFVVIADTGEQTPQFGPVLVVDD